MTLRPASDPAILMERFVHGYLRLETEMHHRRFEHERKAMAVAQAALIARTSANPLWWLSLKGFIPWLRFPAERTPAQRLPLLSQRANS